MKLILVHHADAVGPHVDPQRPLSTPGLAAANALADRAREAGFAPAAIWHSGKLRARQTAEPFLRLNPFAEFKMVRGLSPDDPPELILASLRHETRDLLIVGHMPYLPALLQELTGDRGGFPLHGLVALERTETGQWEERKRIL
jgi:phosphohistidine phosphatase